MISRWIAAIGAVLAFMGTGFFLGRKTAPRQVAGAKLPEELVYARTKDDILNCGAFYSPANGAAKPVAIIWVHGWGANFYEPSYVMIGRSLAERHYACLTVNTRMRDVGFNMGERNGKRRRGGGYWGIASEQVQDVAAWIDYAEERGFRRVVLVGHSAGWSAVRLYQSQQQDPRVVGLVLASGAIRPDTQKPDPELLAQATRLVADGKEDDLIRIPKRRFPSFVSAGTYLNFATNYPPDQRDFFGVHTPAPGVTRVHCPLLAFFGTRESDIGTAADLELLKTSAQRQRSGPMRIHTVMIDGADHMYTGHEADVAQTIAQWADTL